MSLSPAAKQRADLIRAAIAEANAQLEALAHTVQVLDMAQERPASIWIPAVTAFEKARTAAGNRVDTLYELVKDGRDVLAGETFDHNITGRAPMPNPFDCFAKRY